MQLLGPDLRALSLTRFCDDAWLKATLVPCTQLTYLNLSGLARRGGDAPVDECLRDEHIQSLQVLQLGDSDLMPRDASSFRDRLRSNKSALPLRVLSLTEGKLQCEGLEAVRDLLREQPSIDYVEIDSDFWMLNTPWRWGDGQFACSEYAAVRTQLEDDYRCALVSVDAKIAFMGVLGTYASIEMSVVEQIFAYAGRSTLQGLVWRPVYSL